MNLPFSKDYKREYITIFIIQVTEVLGFSLILPFLPYLANEMGASALTIGLISTSFSLFQFFSAPIMGSLSDHYGRKPLLVLSQISTMISFIILGLANSVLLLFISRIVDGLLGSNFTIAQAYLSDISTKKKRSQAFGLSGAAFGFGFLVGPAIGGLLSSYGFQVPAFLAAGVTLITILITTFLLPETIKKPDKVKLTLEFFPIKRLKKYLENKILTKRISQFFVYLLAHIIWVSSFSLYARLKLGIEPREIGFLLAYIGFISIIVRGVLLNKIIEIFGEERLAKIGLISSAAGLLLTAFAKNTIMLLPAMTLFSFGSGVFRPVALGGISKKVKQQEQGAVLGVTNSLGSIAQIIGPAVGGAAISFFSPQALGVIASLTMIASLIIF